MAKRIKGGKKDMKSSSKIKTGKEFEEASAKLLAKMIQDEENGLSPVTGGRVKGDDGS